MVTERPRRHRLVDFIRRLIPARKPAGPCCRVCGCTDDNACRALVERPVFSYWMPCHWVEDDLCSACAHGWGSPTCS